ncbi:MAG TPA: anti-sigma factor [Acidobacteriaceae bacterium]|nr:anti-sigma factor [Acidobacteriaceae bacterium]
MNTTNHITPDDLNLFALQLLPETAMKDAAAHLKECAECRAWLGEIQGDLMTYALTAELHTPPAAARERLLRQVAEEKKVIPIAAPVAAPVELEQQEHTEPMLYPRNSRTFQRDEPEEPEPRRWIAPALAWAGWSIAACMAVVAGMQVDQRKLAEQDLSVATAQLSQSAIQTEHAKQVVNTLRDASAMQVAMHVPLAAGAAPKLDPEGHATYAPNTGALVFVADHLDPLQPDKTYQLWLLPEKTGATPIPAGLFKPDANGNATVVMPPLPKGVTARGFGVTVENEGGSKTPTLPVVLSGT